MNLLQYNIIVKVSFGKCYICTDEGVWRGWVKGGGEGLIQVDSPQGLAGILKGFPLIHLELGSQDGYQN